jgi:tetratricopeptide (TPR) repeat protein
MKLFSIIAISCLGILVYSNTFHCSFHFDDFFFVVTNHHIKDLHQLADIWDWWPCRFITFLSFAINYHFNHLDVFGYHLFNLAVHLCSALLVCWLVELTFLTPVMKEERIARHGHFIAISAGLIFVSHPVQTQAVTFIWQRSASMAAMFYLASLCFYVKSRLAREAVKRPNSFDIARFAYIGSLMTASLAMFTKEIAITLPLMVLLYEFSFFDPKRINWKPLIPFILTFLIIPAVWFFTESEKIQARQSFVTNIPSMQYLLTEFRVMITYIRLAFLPLHQNLDYDFPLSKSIFEAATFSSMIILIAILFAAKRMFSKYRLISFSIFWFFLTLLPESSFFPFSDVIFEHRLYLPMAGFSILLAGGLYYLLGKKTLNYFFLSLAIIIACYSLLTYERNKVWKNEITLWENAVQGSPHKARPYDNLGVGLAHHGNLTQAILDYNKAIEIFPNFTEAYYNRGVGYAKKGDLNKALSDFNKAIAIKPDFLQAYYDRAVTYYELKDYNKAWSDVRIVQALGYVVNPDLINKLKQVSQF